MKKSGRRSGLIALEIERDSQLVRLCIEEASRSRESVERWRRQRRSLERLPPHLANALLCRLHSRRLLFPSLLEVFKHSVDHIDLSGENSVDAEWLAYIGSFSNLCSLNLSDSHRITSSAIWPIAGLTSLKELNLARCFKVTDAGIRHLLSIPKLEKLWISETAVTQEGVQLLASLRNLSLLDLGGLPVTDAALNHLQVLTNLEYLDLWGSRITDKANDVLLKFQGLSFLSLAWTYVTKAPSISSLERLYLSNCTISSVVGDGSNTAHLRELVLSGANFVNEAEAFVLTGTSLISFLDLSNSSLQNFNFLAQMKLLEHLDLSSTVLGDDSVESIACVGANLKNLNLRKTRVTSAGVGILTGHVPNLEVLSLSHTLVDDVAITYISLMPLLKFLDLSNTKIRGLVTQADSEEEEEPILTLAALQNLDHLESLNLEHNYLSDAALCPLTNFKVLKHLFLWSPSLTDASMHDLLSLPKLESLGVRNAVLTSQGLDSIRPQAALRSLDLGGCWLLSKEAVSSFCRRYPHIQLKHELVVSHACDQNSFLQPSPPRISLKALQTNKKHEQVPLSECVVDQRLRYSREELLGLQDSPLVQKRNLMIPHMRTD